MTWKWRIQGDEVANAEVDEATKVVNEEPSLTNEQFRGSADINAIVRRMGVTDGSVLPATLGITDPRYYADLEGVPDLRTALDQAMDTHEKFLRLPADVRARFHNRPELLYEFVTNEANAEESVRLGLLKRFESPGVVVPEVKPPANGA